MTSGRKVVGVFRSLANTKGLQLEGARVLHDKKLVPVLLNGTKTIIMREKERPMIRAVQIDNFRYLLSIKKMHK